MRMLSKFNSLQNEMIENNYGVCLISVQRLGFISINATERTNFVVGTNISCSFDGYPCSRCSLEGCNTNLVLEQHQCTDRRWICYPRRIMRWTEHLELHCIEYVRINVGNVRIQWNQRCQNFNNYLIINWIF